MRFVKEFGAQVPPEMDLRMVSAQLDRIVTEYVRHLANHGVEPDSIHWLVMQRKHADNPNAEFRASITYEAGAAVDAEFRASNSWTQTVLNFFNQAAA